MIQRTLTHPWEHHRGTLGGIWEVWRQDQLDNHYAVPWQAVTLPHCFNAQDAVDPDTLYYQGPGWYRTYLKVENPYPRGRTLLHFEGAGQTTDVYVYTRHLARHRGGYDGFTVDITDALDQSRHLDCYRGRVPLAICCDNSRDLERIPSDIADFHLYGGPYRPTHLIYVPEVSLERLHVHTQVADDGQATVTVQGRLHNPIAAQEGLAIRVTLTAPDGRVIHESRTERKPWFGLAPVATCSVELPQRWSVDDPRLYTCTAELEIAGQRTEIIERFGIRTFSFEKKGPFLLNGQRLLLRGTHRHEDHAGVGAAMDEATTRREMQMIKAMGCNFLRLGHYQQSETVLRLCDELGILIFEEIPWCRGGVGGPAYRQQCRDMLTAMIDQHFNHPSVIVWGMGNEIDWQGDQEAYDPSEVKNFLQELHDLSHQLDPTRPTGLRRCEFAREVIDVYSPSIWAGWYRGIYTEYERYAREGFEQVDRFLHLEWGADSLAGRHSEAPFTGIDVIATGQGAAEQDGEFMKTGGNPRVALHGDWSESYFCDLIDWYLQAQERMDWLTGSAQWVFKDFATPVRPENGLPYVNCKGVVERDLTPKESYYVFQSYWSEQPMLRIHGHHAPYRWGRPGESRTVKVYANCSSVRLRVNGQDQGVRQRESRNFPAAGLRWEVVFQPGENVLEAIAEKNGHTITDTLAFIYQTDPWGAPARLDLSQHPGPEGRITVQVVARDAQGIRCLDAAARVRFGHAGDGRLIDNLGTLRGARVVELINGRARIDVDPAGGRCVVSVQSEGLPTAWIALEGVPS